MRRFWSSLLWSGLLLGLVCGCIRVDYVGQSYPERCHGAVVFYSNRKKIPHGEYRIMGRLVLKAANGTDGYDIQDKLIAEAAGRGADAVVLISSKKVQVGILPNTVGHPIITATPKNAPNMALNGMRIEEDSFGKIRHLGGNYETRSEIHVRALLLIRGEAYEALRSNQQEDAEPVLMREDPSGKPLTLPPVSPDLPDETADASDRMKVSGNAPSEQSQAVDDEESLFVPAPGPMALPQTDPDLQKIVSSPIEKKAAPPVKPYFQKD